VLAGRRPRARRGRDHGENRAILVAPPAYVAATRFGRESRSRTRPARENGGGAASPGWSRATPRRNCPCARSTRSVSEIPADRTRETESEARLLGGLMPTTSAGDRQGSGAGRQAKPDQLFALRHLVFQRQGPMASRPKSAGRPKPAQSAQRARGAKRRMICIARLSKNASPHSMPSTSTI